MDIKKKADRDRMKRKQQADDILKNHELTGRDIARACTLFEADYIAQQEHSENVSPLFDIQTRDELQQLVKQNAAEYRDYKAIMDAVDWTKRTYPLVQSMGQQALFNQAKLTSFLKTSIASHDSTRYRDKLPVIMTQEQLEAVRSVSLNKWLYIDGDSKRPKTESLITFILRGLFFHAHKRENRTPYDSLLRKTFSLYDREPTTSTYIKANYAKAHHRGYHITPDGIRSDRVSEEDWMKKAAPALYEELQFREAHGGKPSANGLNWILENLRIRNRVVLNGGTDEEAEKAVTKRAIAQGRYVQTKFVPYDYADLPERESLTKREMLLHGYSMRLYFPALFSGVTDNPEEVQLQLEDFCMEYRAAIDRLIEEIDQQYYDLIQFPEGVQRPLIPSVDAIPQEDWTRCFVSWESLYKGNVFGLADDLNQPCAIFVDNPRAIKNGVAVLEQPGVQLFNFTLNRGWLHFGLDLQKNDFVPGNGVTDGTKPFYSFPETESSLQGETLRSLFPDSPKYAATKESLRYARKYLLYSFYCVRTYNALIDLFIKAYKLPEMEGMKAVVTEGVIRQNIEVLNDYIGSLYCLLKGSKFEDPVNLLDERTPDYFHPATGGGDPEYFVYFGITPETDKEKDVQDRELQALRDNFNPVSPEEVAADPAKLGEVKKNLKGGKAFSMVTPEGMDWITSTAFSLPDDFHIEGI